tara:strand:+ start:960 stop:1142 length:183 start_codon:yes stop_codon:yes gene_type:complete
MSQAIQEVYNLGFVAGSNWRSEKVDKNTRRSAAAILDSNPNLNAELNEAWNRGYNAGFDG